MDGYPQLTLSHVTYWWIPIVHSTYVATINVEVDASHLLVMFHFEPSEQTLVRSSCPVHALHYKAMKRTLVQHCDHYM